MGLKQILIGTLLISAVILGLTSMLGAMASDYGVTIENDTWQGTYNVVQNISDLVGEQGEVIDEAGTDTTAFDPWAKLGAVVKMIGKIPSLIGNMISDFFATLFRGAVTVYELIALTLVSIIVIFAILDAFRRWKH